uniref:Putative secreted peptide n=1 Tax=Anopheles braziliensis TaxID=58242 RepID=A0A2M3ZW75_9DIPT
MVPLLPCFLLLQPATCELADTATVRGSLRGAFPVLSGTIPIIIIFTVPSLRCTAVPTAATVIFLFLVKRWSNGGCPLRTAGRCLTIETKQRGGGLLERVVVSLLFTHHQTTFLRGRCP